MRQRMKIKTSGLNQNELYKSPSALILAAHLLLSFFLFLIILQQASVVTSSKVQKIIRVTAANNHTSSEAQQPQLVLQTGHSGLIQRLLFSGDEKLLASFGSEETIRVWDVERAQEVRRINAEVRHGIFSAVAFTPDGKFLAWADQAGVKVQSLNSDENPKEIFKHRDISAIAFRPDGRSLLVGDFHGVLQEIYLSTASPPNVLSTDNEPVTHITFSKKAERMAVGYWNGFIKIFQLVPHPQKIYEDRTPKNISDITFNDEGYLLCIVISTQSGNAQSREPSAKVSQSEEGELSKHDQGKNTFTILNIDSTIELITLNKGKVFRASLSEDGRRLAVQRRSAVDGSIEIAVFDTNAMEEVFKQSGLAMIPTDTFTLSNNGNHLGYSFSGSRIQLWDVDSKQQLSTTSGPIEPIAKVGFIPRSQKLYTSSYSRVQIWDLVSGRPEMSWVAVNGQVAFSQNGEWAAFPDPEKGLVRLNLRTNELRPVMDKRVGNINKVVMNSDGSRVSWVDESSVKVWGVDYKEGPVSLCRSGTVSGVLTVSPSGKLLAAVCDHSGVKKIKVWDLHTLSETYSKELMTSDVLAFSPDDRVLASASESITIMELDRVASSFDLSNPIGQFRYRDIRFGSRNTIIAAAAIHPHGLDARPTYDSQIQIFDLAKRQNISSWNVNSRVDRIDVNDNGIILASGLDGSAKIFDRLNNELLISLMSAAEAGWLVVKPDGYFDGTADAMRWVGWRDTKHSPVIPLDAFYNTFFYPGLLADIFEGKRPKPKVDISTTLRFPGLRTMAQQGLAHIEQRDGAVYLCLTQQAGSSTEDNVQVRGRGEPIDLTKGFVKDPEDVRCTYRMELPKDGGPYELVGVSDGWKPSKTPSGKPVGKVEMTRSVLHVMTVGIDKYSRNYGPLRFPVADADAIEKFFRDQKARPQKLYADIQVWDGQRDDAATLKGIRERLAEMVRVVKGNDVVFLFLSGHGRVPPGQSMFYFIPYIPPFATDSWEVKPLDEREEGLSTAMLAEAVRNLPARRVVLVVDACQSGGAVESLAKVGDVKLAIEKRRTARAPSGTDYSQEVGVYILAAATPVQEAGEPVPGEAPDSLKHGLLTTALLEALQGTGTTADGKVWMRDVMERVGRRVPELAEEVSKGRTKKWVQTAFSVSVGRADFPVAIK